MSSEVDALAELSTEYIRSWRYVFHQIDPGVLFFDKIAPCDSRLLPPAELVVRNMCQSEEFASPDADKIGAGMPQTTILVIEDEPLIRMTVADELNDVGFDVLEAANAEEALRLLSEDGLIQAIFTDVELNGKLDGLELAGMVKDRWPLIEIIITSGNRSVTQSEMPQGSLFFPKPYAHQAIIDALNQLTAQKGV